MFEPRLILHPTDFSALSQYAFQVALDLARQHSGTGLVLHVAETLGPENITYGEAVSQLEPENHRLRLEAEVRRQLSAPSDVTVEYLVAEGDPAHAIIRVARERQCHLIVMGTHDRSVLSRLLLGSGTEKVIHQAPCSVLICKPHGATQSVAESTASL
jgi:nucleotide-binding universal stress UspA family protein